MNRSFCLDDTTLSLTGTGPSMPFDNIYIFNNNTIALPFYAQDFADLSLVFAHKDFYLVVFFYMPFILSHEPILHRFKII
jgi:hypothetical protein